MQRWEIKYPTPQFDRDLERAAAELGLEARRMDLKSRPRKMHWHLKLPGSKGTLEATWLIESGEAWLSVHANRNVDWVPVAAQGLLMTLSGLSKR